MRSIQGNSVNVLNRSACLRSGAAGERLFRRERVPRDPSEVLEAFDLIVRERVRLLPEHDDGADVASRVGAERRNHDRADGAITIERTGFAISATTRES